MSCRACSQERLGSSRSGWRSGHAVRRIFAHQFAASRRTQDSAPMRILTTILRARTDTGTSSTSGRVKGRASGISSRQTRTGPECPLRCMRTSPDTAVVIPAGEYAWMTGAFEGHTDPSAPINARVIQRIGSFYDGDYIGWDLTIGFRVGARFISDSGQGRLRVRQSRESAGVDSIQSTDLVHLVEHPHN